MPHLSQQLAEAVSDYEEQNEYEAPKTQSLDSSFEDHWEKKVNIDYSDFENQDKVFREDAAKQEFMEFYEIPAVRTFIHDQKENPKNVAPEELPEDVQNALHKYALNPGFRLAINSLANPENAKDADNLGGSGVFQAMDSHINQHLMEQTLKPVGKDVDISKQELNQTRNKQRLMAKMMLMQQMGDFCQTEEWKNDGNGLFREHPYTETMAESFAHGGRTGFILPPGVEQDQIFDSLLGENNGKSAGVEGRTAATHAFSKKKVDDMGNSTKDFKEVKSHWYNPSTYQNQYGMDISVGGVGNKGATGETIRNDGKGGHLYMRIEKGDKNTCGALMVGLESEAPGKTGTTGHKHDWRATAAKQSAFLSSKSTHGAKTDGRTVDLSHVDAKSFTNVMNAFDTYYYNLQQQALSNDKQTAEKATNTLETLNHKLAGKPLQKSDLQNILEDVTKGAAEIKKSEEDKKQAKLTAGQENATKNASRNKKPSTLAKKAEKVAETKDLQSSVQDIMQNGKKHDVRLPKGPKSPGLFTRFASLFSKSKKEICNNYDTYKQQLSDAGINPPGKWDRFKAFFGNKKSKQAIEDYNKKVQEYKHDPGTSQKYDKDTDNLISKAEEKSPKKKMENILSSKLSMAENTVKKPNAIQPNKSNSNTHQKGGRSNA